MAYLIGSILSLAGIGVATAIGVGRERAFYPTLLVVIASYYVLFAVLGAPRHTVVIEAMVAGIFVSVAVIGYKTNFWIVVFALLRMRPSTSSITSSLKTFGSLIGGLALFSIRYDYEWIPRGLADQAFQFFSQSAGCSRPSF